MDSSMAFGYISNKHHHSFTLRPYEMMAYFVYYGYTTGNMTT